MKSSRSPEGIDLPLNQGIYLLTQSQVEFKTMADAGSPQTFESLMAVDNARLEQFMHGGGTPTLADVVGYEFRGFNLQRLTVLIGTRKFKKGFYGHPEEGHIWGYNVRVVQNKLSEPWIALPSDANPKRLLFFKVFPAQPGGRDSDYANSLVVDYSKWSGYSVVSPSRYLVDYLVFPDPQNRDLILGISYFAIARARTFAGYFILERYNKSDFSPPGT
jgi:hypothetical protein